MRKEATLAKTKAYYTLDEYFAIDDDAEVRSEYYDGQIFAMAGGTYDHSQIGSNVLVELGVQLRGRPCSAHGSDLRVEAGTSGLYTYADVVVVCGDPILTAPKDNTLVNPVVIVEVLSDSTESYDRRVKFENYKTIKSLKDYVLIAQDRVWLEHYTRRPDGGWARSVADKKGDVVALESIGCGLKLSDVYDKVRFSAKRNRRSSRTTVGEKSNGL